VSWVCRMRRMREKFERKVRKKLMRCMRLLMWANCVLNSAYNDVSVFNTEYRDVIDDLYETRVKLFITINYLEKVIEDLRDNKRDCP